MKNLAIFTTGAIFGVGAIIGILAWGYQNQIHNHNESDVIFDDDVLKVIRTSTYKEGDMLDLAVIHYKKNRYNQ